MAWDIFKNLVSRGAMAKEDAFYAILYASAMADGVLAAQESEEVIALAHRTKTLQGLSNVDLNLLHGRIEEQFKAGFDTALEDACASIPVEVAESIFAHAADIVFADGKVVSREVEYLQKLAEKLRIDQAFAAKVMDVLRIKNAF